MLYSAHQNVTPLWWPGQLVARQVVRALCLTTGLPAFLPKIDLLMGIVFLRARSPLAVSQRLGRVSAKGQAFPCTRAGDRQHGALGRRNHASVPPLLLGQDGVIDDEEGLEYLN